MAAESDRRPNIVWLLTDHHIYRHHRELSGRPAMPTYDRLRREGVHFERAQSICPLCTPARASMLTGVYPHRHGMVMNNGNSGSRLDFEPEQELFSHRLRDAGYRVGYFGKWHCGNERSAPDYGFEGYSPTGYGCPYVTDEYREYCRELGIPEARMMLEWRWRNEDVRGRELSVWGEEHPWSYMASSGVMTTPLESHEACFVTHLANRWLTEAAAGPDPFCLRVDVWGPHFPYWVGGEFADSVAPESIDEYPNARHTLADRPGNHRSYRDLQREKCTGTVDWLDWRPIVARAYEHAHLVDDVLGRVLDQIDRLGIADDTIVIYTADHGDMAGSQGGLFDKGSMMVEETMRIPLAVRWPGRVPAGVVTDALVSNMDLVPTVLDAAGAHIPSPTDGRSLLELARDPAGADWPDDLMCTHHGHGRPHFQRLLRWGDWKYVARPDDIDELYDLASDPYELTNRIDDSGLKDILAEARSRLAAQMLEHDDDEPDSLNLRAKMG